MDGPRPVYTSRCSRPSPTHPAGYPAPLPEARGATGTRKRCLPPAGTRILRARSRAPHWAIPHRHQTPLSMSRRRRIDEATPLLRITISGHAPAPSFSSARPCCSGRCRLRCTAGGARRLAHTHRAAGARGCWRRPAHTSIHRRIHRVLWLHSHMQPDANRKRVCARARAGECVRCSRWPARRGASPRGRWPGTCLPARPRPTRPARSAAAASVAARPSSAQASPCAMAANMCLRQAALRPSVTSLAQHRRLLCS